MRKKIIGIFVCMLLIGATTVAIADWEEGDGHKMHFPQLPIHMVGTLTSTTGSLVMTGGAVKQEM